MERDNNTTLCKKYLGTVITLGEIYKKIYAYIRSKFIETLIKLSTGVSAQFNKI